VSQTVLFVAVYALGLAMTLSLGPYRRPWLCGAVAYLVGLTTWIVVYFAACVVGVPFGRAGAAAVFAALFGGLVVVGQRRGRLTAETLRVALVCTGIWAALAAIFSSFNASNFSPDSFQITLTGRLFGLGGLTEPVWEGMAARSLFHPFAHAHGSLVGLDYLYAHHPMIGVGLLTSLTGLMYAGLQRLQVSRGRSLTVSALAAVALTSTYVFAWHFFYVHANFGAGAYLMLFAAAFWFGEVESDAGWLVVAAVAMVGLALQRFETNLVAALFFGLLTARTRFTPQDIARSFGPAVAAICIWLALVAINGESRFLNRPKAFVMGAVLIAAYAYVRSGWWPRLRQAVPPLVVVVLVLGLAWAFATRPAQMLLAVENLYRNVFTLEWISWGLTPWVLTALAILAWRAPRLPADTGFAYGIPAFVLFVLLIVRMRSGAYRLGWGDSGNRMMVHVLAVALFYVAMRLGASWTEARAEVSATPDEARRSGSA
jgi:hypothetical protein